MGAEAIPAADAIVSVGHVLSYLPDAAAIDRPLVACVEALVKTGIRRADDGIRTRDPHLAKKIFGKTDAPDLRRHVGVVL